MPYVQSPGDNCVYFDNSDCKWILCTFDGHFYPKCRNMHEHNKPITLTLNKQQIINNPNTHDVFNVIDALKKVIYKLGTKLDFALQQTACDAYWVLELWACCAHPCPKIG